MQALIDQVASKCESCMDSASTARNRSVNPNQGWRWRKQNRRRENSSQDTTPDSQGGPESPVGPERPSENSGHWRGNNGARARRRQAARRGFDGPEAQRLQRLFRRNRKSCVREILNGSEDRRCNIPLNTLEAISGMSIPQWMSISTIRRPGYRTV